MKTSFLSLLTVAASVALFPCCLSCTQKNNTDDNHGHENVDDGKPKAGDYSFTAPALKGQWVAGDQILVHGSYGPAATVYTLQASNLSADGKTATVKLDGKVMEYFSAPDQLYAAWPASAVQAEDGLLDATTTFTQANIHLAQAYLDGTNFRFDDASGVLSFTVSGDFDRVIIAAADRAGMRFTEYKNAHSTKDTGFAKVSTDGYPYREESLTGSAASIWFPGNTTLKGGFTLYFGKGDSWTKSYTYAQNVDLPAGQKLELGDITAKLEAYTGIKPAMPEMGQRTKYTVKFNELSGLCLSADGTFLWGVDDNGGLGKFSFAGEVLYKKSTGGEFEGITIDPATGDLLVGNEEPVSIYRFAAPAYDNKVKLFEIPGTSGFGNAGLEGLTYYKDGMILAGMQTGSYLFCCKLSTGEVVWKKEMRKLFPAITEIAGLCYDPLTDWLWIIDSESHRFFALTGDAERMLGFYTMKGTDNPEAICVDHKNSCIWVGDDAGSTSYLYKYEFTGLDDAILQ